jgi:hypothetical protein
MPFKPPSLRQFGPGVAGLFSALVYLSLPLMPFPGLFLALMAPLPLLQVAAAGRATFLAWGWVAVVGAGAVFLTSSAWLAAVLVGYLLITVWPAASVEIWLRRGWSEGRWLAVVTLVVLVVTGAGMMATLAPLHPAEFVERELDASLQQLPEVSQALQRSLLSSPLSLSFFRASLYLPAAWIAIYVAAVALFARPRLVLLGLGERTGAFCEFRSEEWLPVGFIFGGLGWVLLPEPGKWLAANLLVTVAGLYFVHGLAIIHFYLGPRLRSNRWIRAGVLLLALQLPVALALAVAGLADSFVRLRRSAETDEGSAS